MNQHALHAGRPRDARLDDALVQAGMEVFFERGYHRASLAEIARRAHVRTPAIYRRWPTKAALAIDIVIRDAQPAPIPDTGSIRDDLVQFMLLRLRQWRTPIARQIMLPVIVEGVSDPGLAEQIRTAFVGYRQALEDRVRRSVDAGELSADTDPQRLLDMLMGAITMPVLFAQDLPEDSEAESIVARALDGFAARP